MALAVVWWIRVPHTLVCLDLLTRTVSDDIGWPWTFWSSYIGGGFCWIITQHLRKLRWLAGKSLCLRKYIFKLMVVYYSPKNAGTKTHHPSPSLPEICEFEILHSEVSSKVKSRSDSSRFWLLVISSYSARNVSISNIIRTTKSSTQTCLRKRVW